ncbi:MAG: toxin-antitoxin system HicB family antitoxin [Crinalium sp.]
MDADYADDILKFNSISRDNFVAVAVAEKISALTTESYLQERTKRGSRDKYLAVLAKVPDIEPEPDDRLPSV